MANKKISELTAISAPDNADVLPLVDVSAAETKKITWANILAALASVFVTGVGTRTITVSDTEPTSPTLGDLWVDTSV